VIRVEDVNGTPYVTRDLALIKVKTTAKTRADVLQMCGHFPARIVDVALNSILIEVVGEEAEIEGIVELLRPHGIIEMVRAGVVAMGRADNVLDTHCERSSWAARQYRLSKAS
jgi:acetolactate synthase-1/3 small subunit